MGSTEVSSRPKLYQNSVTMWQRQKQDWIDRSTIAFNKSKNRAQQSTMDAWNNSKNRAQQSTMGTWSSSKTRCQRTTMGAWHKSADSFYNSKDRAQQSARAMVDRSVSRWNESADQMHQAIRVKRSEDPEMRPRQSSDTTSPPSSPDSTKSGSRFYAQANISTVSSATTAVEVPTKTQPIQPASAVNTSASPKEQIRALYDAACTTSLLVDQTRRLRDDRSHILGEIELDWVNSTITEADETSKTLSSFIQPFWVAHCKESDGEALERKTWTRRDIQRALKKESRMLQAHSKVETVFGHLVSLPAEMNISSAELKDMEGLALHGVSELPATRLVSVAELPGDSLPVLNNYAELSSPMAIPTIVVTQHDGDEDDDISMRGRSPPPSYEISEVDGVHEIR
ncbi:unnamed protein product [Penicillium olsonii]|nr:unnamed protein product [Penicillium olsonii]